ncbi:MAG: TerB family tellurite resistance protein [Victivallales bacterium]
MSNDIKHPLRQHPEKVRTSYLSLLASMANADGKIEASELNKLKEFCRIAGLSESSLQEVVKAATEKTDDKILAQLQTLKTSNLRFSIITDCIFMACADGIVVAEEEKEISRIAGSLEVKENQIKAISFYVDRVNSIVKDKKKYDPATVGKELKDTLKAASVPVEAVAFAFESLPYYENQDMQEVLKALGYGIGMLTGIGPLIMLGLFGWKSVKWLGKNIS